MLEQKSIPIPLALRELILSNNQLLKNYQEELSHKVILANQEMMTLLNLSEADGWVLDIKTMSYTQHTTSDDS